MAIKVVTVLDFMRGGHEEVTIRFDPEDLVRLPCHCEYDPALCSKNGNEVMLVRKVEVQNSDNSWSPYPSISWLDGVEDEDQLLTRAVIKKTGEDSCSIMGSSQGVPDGTLMSAAKKAGIYTETIG
jgi:hypothetical protein